MKSIISIISTIVFINGFFVDARAQSPQFTSTPVENGEYDAVYQYDITTSPGAGDLEIILTAGALPAGITLTDFGDGTGQLAGTPTETGSFPIELTVREILNPSSSDTQNFTLTIDKATATVSLDDLTTTYNGSQQSPTVTTTPSGLTVDVTYDGSTTVPTNAGSYEVVATVNDANYSGSATGTFTINKATATVTLGNMSVTYNGNPQSPTVTTTPSGLTVDVTYDGSTTIPTNAGSYEVVATVNDANYSGSATGTFTINKATATVTLDNMTVTYNGNPQSPTVTTTPSGLTVDVTYDGSTTIPTNAGSYEVVATVNDANYSGSATGTFTINKATATVTLDNMTVTYNGNPQSPTVTTTPSGLTVDVTYDGSTTIPTNAGSYEVVATVNDANYSGSATGTFTINKATATVTLDNMTVTYNGNPQSPTVTTTPSGLTVDVTYDGSTTVPTNAGSYEVVATVNDANYSGSATGTFTINKATATVTLDGMTVTYNGSPRSPTVTTTPSGLTVNLTYDGSTTAPTNAGSYEVIATVNDANYSGSATGTFTINKATATVTLGSLTATYDGTPKPVTVTTNPSGLDVDVTYDGSLTPPTNVGSYTVVAMIDDANYTGSASNTFSITKATATVSLSNTIQTYDGAPKMVTVTTTPSGLTVNVTYAGSATPPTNAGTYAVVATVDDSNYEGTTSGTLQVEKATAVVTISNLNQNFDGSPKPVTVTTVPADLTTTVTYNGSPTAPTSPGSYTVVAQISSGEANYQGTSTKTLVINGPPTTSGISDVNVNEDAANYNIGLRPVFADAEDSDTALEFAVVNNTNPSLFTSTTINSSDVLILDFAPNQNGEAYITVRVTDTGGLFVEDEFKVSIAPVQDNPIFTSTPVLGALRGSSYVYNSQATDPDAGDVLTYTSSGYPDWLTFQDNGGGSGTLSGTPGADDIGNHNVILVVSDGGRQAVQSFQITVAETNFNPSITSTPITSVNEDEIYSYYVTATDPDVGDTPTISIITKPDWLTLDEDDDVLQGTPTNADVGEHDVVVRATDIFGAYDEQSFTITVINVNDAPEFTSEPVTTATQNVQYVYNIEIQDEDLNDTYTITATTTPSWLGQPVDNGNGTATLSGTPPVSTTNFEEYNVALVVEDAAGATDEQSFTITVEYQNYPPTLDPITDQGPFNEDYSGTITVPLTGISAGDGESQTLAITAVSDNESLISTIDVNYTSPEVGGSLSFKPAADQSGVANITVTVQDNGAESFNSVSRSFQVTIDPVNDKPLFATTQADQRVRIGEEFTASVEATDADAGDMLKITMNTDANWLSLDDNGDGTAIVSGTVPQSASGTDYLVTLTVADQAGEFSTSAFTISVNTPPVASNVDLLLDEDTEYAFSLEDFSAGFTDEDGDVIRKIRIESLPEFVRSFTWKGQNIQVGTEIEVVNGVIEQFEYTPPMDEAGNTSFSWSAYDGYDWSNTAEVSIEVQSLNDRPVLTNTETAAITFKQGDDPIPVTETTIINDADNIEMQGATIAFTGGYVNGEDVLQYDNTLNPKITGEFNTSEGVLTLTGADTRSNYEKALSDVKYRNVVLGVTDVTDKQISIAVTDGLDYSNSVTRKVIITEVLPEVDIVNAFTPNNDGANDYWDFENLEYYTAIKISVFNEDGTRVFSCSNVDCKWDGTMEGKTLPAGPYFYTIDLNNGKRKYQGTVTILK